MSSDLKALHHPSLKDRVVVITGGSRGFGWFMAEELLRAGARVTLTGRNGDTLASVLDEAHRIAGAGRCIAVAGDVTRPGDCARTVEETLREFGRIDVLINNAGRSYGEFGDRLSKITPFHDVTESQFRAIVETNLFGVFFMTRAAMPHMLERKFGKVISISTSLLNMVRPGNSVYGSSKAALETAHRCWAGELEGSGIDINILLPGGPSDTDLITPAMVPGVVGQRAGGRLLPGDIIVPPAVWLCTDATNGMTGERVIARFWDADLPPDDAFRGCLQEHVEEPSIM
ncbi:MAG: SDR family NAD(P)-dependent oxidoreductase [Gammaproteobacteria bacterium]|nr:SDR family NAD(P)-dependent oxidoreductase [Gammaproteobacteria bacterium]MDE0414456.1 SDR family NAD(P)-dependent oxidoreductase [Gammaproteobacteria bacterium]